MKYLFTLIFICSFSSFIQAQCSDLFFSEYVEGWSNNKALEIYNPTANTIDLSAYTISRYSNGGTSASTTQLSGTIEAFSTFVIGLRSSISRHRTKVVILLSPLFQIPVQ